tara:strand:+ start:3709 stop:4188 length:480 start_codon:yes stop_codon:yes gene_type:complete
MTSKSQIKKDTKSKIIELYESLGCDIDERKTGSIKYHAISIGGSDQRIAAIYGSLGGAASLWIKKDAWDLVAPNLDRASTRVEDVDLFRRGFQWAVHFHDQYDNALEPVVQASFEAGQTRWNRALKRRADDARRMKVRADKKAEMDAKRNDAWENIESQ